MTKGPSQAIGEVAHAITGLASSVAQVAGAIRDETRSEDDRAARYLRAVQAEAPGPWPERPSIADPVWVRKDGQVIDRPTHYGPAPGARAVCGDIPDDDLITDAALDVTCPECALSLVERFRAVAEARQADVAELEQLVAEQQRDAVILTSEVQRQQAKVQNLSNALGDARREAAAVQAELAQGEVRYHDLQRYVDDTLDLLQADIAAIQAALGDEAPGRDDLEARATTAAPSTVVPAGTFLTTATQADGRPAMYTADGRTQPSAYSRQFPEPW